MAAIVATVALVGAGVWVRSRSHAEPKDANVACAAGTACETHARAGVARAAKIVGQPRLLAFSSTTCAACKRMAPVIEEAARACASRDAVVHVDVDGDDGAALASTYDVTNIPAWISIDGDGEEVTRLVGVQPAEALARSLEELSGRRCAAIANVDALPM